MTMEQFSVLMRYLYNGFEYSTFASTMDALKQPTIWVVAVIAEGVPEADTKKLIAYARVNNKVDD